MTLTEHARLLLVEVDDLATRLVLVAARLDELVESSVESSRRTTSGEGIDGTRSNGCYRCNGAHGPKGDTRRPRAVGRDGATEGIPDARQGDDGQRL